MNTTQYTKEQIASIVGFIGKLNLSQTCELLYRCNDDGIENEFIVPALIRRLYQLVDSDRADGIIRMAHDHYGVKIA